jgi:hypothetical protein
MIKIRKIMMLAIALILLAASPAAAEEKKGLIGRIWDTFITGEDNQPKKTQEPQPVKTIQHPPAPAPSAAAKTPGTALPRAGKPVYKSKGDKGAITKKSREEVTVAELAEYIGDLMEMEEEAINQIPEMKRVSERDGKSYYTYNGAKLADLDMETINKLYNRVQAEITKIRTDRIQRQLDNIRQAQQATQAAQQASRAAETVRLQQQVPRVSTPPPTPPSQPPTPPRTPSPPPQPPRR